jgi:mRNA-degrading endonuclease YafQ of YafQ-DinJ toxin-antitoxin module
MSFSALGRTIELMEYFSVYSDYDTPSINLGMYHSSRFTRDKKKRLEKRKIAMEKWKKSQFFGVLSNKVIPLIVKEFDFPCYGEEETLDRDINCDIRVIFQNTKEEMLFVMTEKVEVKSIPLGRSGVPVNKNICWKSSCWTRSTSRYCHKS